MNKETNQALWTVTVKAFKVKYTIGKEVKPRPQNYVSHNAPRLSGSNLNLNGRRLILSPGVTAVKRLDKRGYFI